MKSQNATFLVRFLPRNFTGSKMFTGLAAGQTNCFVAIPQQTAGLESRVFAANFGTKHVNLP